MALISEVFSTKVKQKGYWNYTELYNFCFDWLKDNGYNIKEKEYNEKITDGGKEIKVKWEANKKVTDYFKNTITLKWHILGMKDAEIERDGKREKTNNGEVKIEFKGFLVKDYEDRWEDQPFWKFLRGTYEKYIIRTTIDEYEDRIIDEGKEYVEQIKAFLQIEGR